MGYQEARDGSASDDESVVTEQAHNPEICDFRAESHISEPGARFRLKGKVYSCGMCGEDILHRGNGKVHVNCRTLRDIMGEGEAKRYLHEAVAKRGQKRNAAKTGVSEFSADPARFFSTQAVQIERP